MQLESNNIKSVKREWNYLSRQSFKHDFDEN